MEWTERMIGNLMAELADEDFFACKALLGIMGVEYTDRVPTLAVSLGERPILYINRGFVEAYARSENDVKALLMHEFLHVVLGHTRQYDTCTPLMNLALDAIINALIHRRFGSAYSDFFVEFYPKNGLYRLLASWNYAFRMNNDFCNQIGRPLLEFEVSEGCLDADELHELLEHLLPLEMLNPEFTMIGNHGGWDNGTDTGCRPIVDGIVKRLQIEGLLGEGGGVNTKKRTPEKRSYDTDQPVNDAWYSDTQRIIRECLHGRGNAHRHRPASAVLPILNPGDRKAFLMGSSTPFLPFSRTEVSQEFDEGRAQVYLDLSASFEKELNGIASLLARFRRQISTPLWGFSSFVEQVDFLRGRIACKSDGSTDISCVFRHIAGSGARRALIVTDGFVDSISDAMLRGVNKEGLRVIVSEKGDVNAFKRKGIVTHKLRNMHP